MPFGGLLTVSLIGAGTDIFGGLFGASKAQKAAQQQAAAARQAAGLVQNEANQAGAGVQGAVNQGVKNIGQQTKQANDSLTNAFNIAAGSTQPYTSVGKTGTTNLNNALKPGGFLTQQFSFNPSDLQNDPGYQFQLQQGQKAIENQGSATGLLNSGGTLKALTRYGQGLAGTEFQNAYNRALGTFQTNRNNFLGANMDAAGIGEFGTSQLDQAAMNRGNLSSQNLFNKGVLDTNLGMQGSEYQGNLGMQAALAAGGYLTQAGNAQAAGTVGASNAITGMAGNLGNLGQSLYYGNQIFGGGGGFGGGSIGGPGQGGTYNAPDGGLFGGGWDVSGQGGGGGYPMSGPMAGNPVILQ